MIMVCHGYSSLTIPQPSPEEEKIQNDLDELLGECVSNIEMEYGIVIDLQYSWEFQED